MIESSSCFRFLSLERDRSRFVRLLDFFELCLCFRLRLSNSSDDVGETLQPASSSRRCSITAQRIFSPSRCSGS